MNPGFGHAQAIGPRMMEQGFGHVGLFGGYGVAVGIGLVILAAIAIGLVIWAIARKPSAPRDVVPSPLHAGVDTALNIARERLARGEIDPTQYQAIVEALRT